jgi:hypothetical protein
MVKRVIVHDDVTNTCAQAELVAYPSVVAGTNVTVTPSTNVTTGKITYTVAATGGAGGSDGVVTGASLAPLSKILSLSLSVGGPITVDLSSLDSCDCPPLSGVIVPTVAPAAKESNFYVNTATVPDSLYHWNGAAWSLIGTTLTAASVAAAGIIELATSAEVTAGTDTTKAVVPSTLATELNKIDPCTATVATAAQIAALVGSEPILTCIGGVPRSIKISDVAPGAATVSAAGIVELATSAEVTAGTDATRAVTPATLATELNKLDPCTAVAATNAQVTALTGAETLTICVGGLPRAISLNEIPAVQIDPFATPTARWNVTGRIDVSGCSMPTGATANGYWSCTHNGNGGTSNDFNSTSGLVSGGGLANIIGTSGATNVWASFQNVGSGVTMSTGFADTACFWVPTT